MVGKKVYRIAPLWDYAALQEYLRKIVVPELQTQGQSYLDLYVIWNHFGPGRLGKSNRHFIRLSRNAVKFCLRSMGYSVSMEQKRAGYVIIRTKGGDKNAL